jgi:hypothetical protein
MIQPHPLFSLIILTLGEKYHYETSNNRHFLLSGGPQKEHQHNETRTKMLCDLCPEGGNI